MMQGKQLTTILGTTALLVVGCGSAEAPSKPETATGAAMTTSVAASSPTKRPSSPLSPGGFGANPPDSEQLRELGAWLDGPGLGADEATEAAGAGVEKMQQAADAGDLTGFANACPDATNPLTIRLPASLPTPDPDMTAAFQQLVDDGEVLKSACDAFGTALARATGGGDPPTEGQLDAVLEAIRQIGTDMQTAGTILIRNGDLLRSAAAAIPGG